MVPACAARQLISWSAAILAAVSQILRFASCADLLRHLWPTRGRRPKNHDEARYAARRSILNCLAVRSGYPKHIAGCGVERT